MGRILGADVSLTAPGFCVVNDENVILHLSSMDTKDLRGPQRWHTILLGFLDIIETHQPTAVVFEGYAYSSFKGTVMGEIGGILRYYCYIEKLPYIEVPPNTLKKFFFGHGHAKKEDMIKKAKQLGANPKSSDEADAFALAVYGLQSNIDFLRGG